MPLGHAQLRAKLLWEVACERLRNTLEPPIGPHESSAADRQQAHQLVHEALDAICEAYSIDSIPASDLQAPTNPPPQPDGKAGKAQTS